MRRNSFCTLLQKTSPGEALCRRIHAEAEERAHRSGHPARTRCPFGVSILVSSATVPAPGAGTVLAGQVLLHPLDKLTLSEHLVRYLGEHTADAAEISQLWNAYIHTPLLARGQIQAGPTAPDADLGGTQAAAASAHRSDAMCARDEIDHAIAVLKMNRTGETHVNGSAAHRILLENVTVQVGEHVRYLRLKNLGSGVYAVRLAISGAKPQTLLMK